MNKRIIAKIMDGDTVIMTVDQNLLSVGFGALDRGSLTSVAEWGIYVNRGSLSFIDNTGFFNDETINSVELLDYTIKFYLVDRTSQHLIATFAVKSAKVDDATKKVSIECVSKLEELQRKTEEEDYPFDRQTTQYLLSNCVSHPISAVTDTTGIDCTYIYCPYFPEESTWNRVNKICQATMSRVFDNEEGNSVISGAFPDKTPIIVNPSNILDIRDSNYVRIPNSRIVVTDRKKYVSNSSRLPDVSDTFGVAHKGVDGSFIVFNCDKYTTIDASTTGVTRKNAQIEKLITTPYHLKGNVTLKGSTTIEEYVGDPRPETPNNTYTKQVDFESTSTVSESDVAAINLDITVPDVFLNKPLTHTVSKITNIVIDEFMADHFRDGDNVTINNIIDDNFDTFEISSNDLIQVSSSFTPPQTNSKGIFTRILEEISRRYGQGIECFEIECLFNDYYYDNGEKAFDSEILANHFKKYDVIIPYVMKQGQRVPLRKNTDGTPKNFRIIGISYSYDGLLRQKLQVQEERYDIDYTPMGLE